MAAHLAGDHVGGESIKNLGVPYMPGKAGKELRPASLCLRCRYAPTFCYSPAHAPGTYGSSRAPDVCVALGADAASDCLGSASIDCSPGASYTAPSRRETYKAADIVIFDPDTIASKPRGLVDDLPGGAMHVKQGALGIDDVIVNSEVLREGGEHTGALPGQVLGGPLDDGNR